MAKTAFFCCGLKTGTLTCSIFTLVMSATGIILRYTFDLREYFNSNSGYIIPRGILVNSTLTLAVSIICIYGAIKKSKYCLIPWMVITAVYVVLFFLLGIYYTIFASARAIYIGMQILAVAFMYLYGWVTVSKYYTELRDQTADEIDPEFNDFNRSYLSPSAVTMPAAFASPPPAYGAGMDNPVFDEKPPSYDDVAKKKNEQINV